MSYLALLLPPIVLGLLPLADLLEQWCRPPDSTVDMATTSTG
jgi:hypothetical protein